MGRLRLGYRSWLVIAALGLMAAPPLEIAAGADDPSASELLAHYVQYVDGLKTIQFEVWETTAAKGGAFPDWTWGVTVHGRFVKSGLRWRFWWHTAGFNTVEGTKLPFEGEFEHTFDGKTGIFVNRNDRATRELTGMDEEEAQRRLRSSMGGSVDVTVSAEVDAERPLSADQYMAENQTCALYGYLPSDNLTVADLLRDPAIRLTTRAESVAGRACRVIEGTTRYGRVTLWLDPAASFAPIRLRMVKGEADLMGKVVMRDLKAPTHKSGPAPRLPMRGMELQIDYRIGSIGDRPTIVGYSRLDRFIYEGGSDFQRRDDAELKNIRFDPDPAALEPTLAIPDETQVHIRNSPSLRAKWSSGKLVLDYDKPTIATLQAKWQSDTSDDPLWRRPLALAGAALVALILLCLGWARWHRQGLRSAPGRDARP
jgi:hypothetical protein